MLGYKQIRPTPVFGTARFSVELDYDMADNSTIAYASRKF
jgi:hypothetical protein